jgi:hypothetical protein
MKSSVFREPLFHFLGLAALLFVVNAVFSGDEREVITVDAATQEYLIEQRQNLVLRNLTEQEKAETIETFVEEEVLVREARKRGFENSSRIRTLLIQNMRYFMNGEIAEPTEEELRAFFEQNIELFESPSTVTYDHALFIDPGDIPPDALSLLRSGESPDELGDIDWRNTKIIRASEAAIVATFSRQVAPEILAIEDERWYGPFISDNGVHFLRVAERHPPWRPDWEAAKNWVDSEWLRMKNQEIIDREMAAMLRNYRIEIEQTEQLGE